MADSSSRSLLTSHGDSVKARNGAHTIGDRTALKTPLFITSLVALLVGCIVATVIILLTSHNDRIKNWQFQPAVWLSLLAGIYSIALGGLFFFGVAITWWRSLNYGTTLKSLHHISAGASPMELFPAVKAGGHARRVALAALIVFCARVAVGPLLQRATRPKNRDVERFADMWIHICKQMPDGWHGTWSHIGLPGINVVRDTVLSSTIPTFLNNDETFSCIGGGVCSGLVLGAGLNYAFTTETRTMNLTDLANVNKSVFTIELRMDYDHEQPMLLLATDYVSSIDNACIGTITTDRVHMVPATVPYPISIQNSTITMDSAALIESLLEPETFVQNYTSESDIYDPDNPAKMIGPLGGTFRGLGPVYMARANLTYNGGIFAPAATNESFYAPHWQMIFIDSEQSSNHMGCPPYYRSPTQTVLKAVMEYMFRSAYAAADKNDEDLQTFTARFEGRELRHRTDFQFLAGSVFVMVLGIVAALSLVWGWWQLGRFVTLSPLETGKAFGAPILLKAGAEQEADGIIQAVGEERVAYDGEELVWNGSVYATSVATQADSMGEIEMEHSGGRILRSRTGGSRRRRGTSSVDHTEDVEHDNIRSPPAFRHAVGVSTKQWDDESRIARHGNVKYYRPRFRGGNDNDHSVLYDIPLSLTPGQGGVPELPPIRPGGSNRVEAFGSSRRGRSSGGQFSRPSVTEDDSGIGTNDSSGSGNLKRQPSLIEEGPLIHNI